MVGTPYKSEYCREAALRAALVAGKPFPLSLLQGSPVLCVQLQRWWGAFVLPICPEVFVITLGMVRTHWPTDSKTCADQTHARV